MKFNLEKLDEISSKVIVEVEEKESTQILNKIISKISKEVEVPGFRKGKIPESVIIEKFKETVNELVLNELIGKEFFEFVENNKIKIVGDIEIEDLNIDKKGIKIETKIGYISSFELPEYKSLNIEKPNYKVTEQEVEDIIKNEALENAKLKIVEENEPAILGDYVIIDFEGFIDGMAFEGGKAQDYELKLGSKSFIDNFEEQIIGHRKGDSFDVVVKFPENYKEGLSGKEATFKVKLKTIKRPEISNIDDEFAIAMGYNNIEEMKKDRFKELENKKREEAEYIYFNQIIQAIVSKVNINYPESFFNKVLSKHISYTEENLKAHGQTLDSFLKNVGKTKEKFFDEIKVSVHNFLKKRIVIDKIIEKEKITYSEEELDNAFTSVASSYGYSDEAFENQLNKSNMYEKFMRELEERLLEDKVKDFIVNL